jgi:hypothetical protein
LVGAKLQSSLDSGSLLDFVSPPAWACSMHSGWLLNREFYLQPF